MSSSETPIEVSHISKRYGTFQAVDDVSFRVEKGRVFGLLGPNGAGKTTTIRMIMNIIAPDTGTVTVLGRPSSKGVSGSVGYLPEERGLYRKMKVLDHLVFLGEIKGLSGAESKRRSIQWLERVGLSDRAGKKVEELSKGMQQKIQFAGCVLHEPEVLILDEPFSGLDPVNQRVLKELLSDYKSSGRTLVFSTHIMEQAEKLCDDIVLINRSKVVLEGTLADVKRRFSANRLTVKGAGALADLQSLPMVAEAAGVDGKAEVALADESQAPEFIQALASKWRLESVVPHEASLDEIFVAVVGDAGIEREAVVA